MAHTITVTDCGTSSYNATYSYAGTQNSRPYWSNGSTSYIYSINNSFEGVNYWVLSDALTDDPGLFPQDSCYALESDANIPPKFGLVAVNGATAGDPVLAAQQERFEATGSHTTTAVDGFYVWAEIYNSRAAFVDEADEYNWSWNSGVGRWQVREGTTVGSGTVVYESNADQDDAPDGNWLSSPPDHGPDTISNYTLELVEDEFTRIDSLDDNSASFSVSGGSGETVDEVIGRDIEYSSTPPNDTLFITPGTSAANTTLFGLPMPDGVYQISSIKLRPYLRKPAGGWNYHQRIVVDGVNSTYALAQRDAKDPAGWVGEDTFSADSNAGSITWPIEPSTAEPQVAYLDDGGSGTIEIMLVNVWMTYTYWATAADTTAPTLTSAGYSSVGSTTANGDVTTDEDNGTLYGVVTTSSTAPSAAQVKAGQDHTGSAATFDDSQAISSTGAKQFSATGLTVSTSYYWHFMHEDAATNQSTVVSSGQFTTSAAPSPSASGPFAAGPFAAPYSGGWM